MSTLKNPNQIKNDITFGIIEIGESAGKLSLDFIYIFKDKLNLGDVVRLEDAVKCKYELYICCTYNRNDAQKKLEGMGLNYKKDYYFAEDFFYLLDDWKKKKIAYKSYPGTFKGCLKAIAFGFVAKHGKNIPKKNQRLFYAVNLVPGLLETFPQVFAKSKEYEKYDYICFESVSDAIRYKEDYPLSRDRVITVEELRTHTMASKYMSATYFDKRQNSCACDMPFDMLWIGREGSSRLCECPDYLDVGCGNIGVTDIQEAWQSPLAKIIRLSAVNNTYTFCSRELCGLLSEDKECDTILERREVEEILSPLHINVAIDTVCNLHCPSCRKSLCAKNNENAELVVKTCTDAILNSGWLESAEELMVGGSGESFLSKHYKSVIYEGAGKRKNIVIMTNGTLFTPEEWKRLEGKYEHIGFMVSIDAATKDTYEKVRCGGNFDKLMSNMDFLSNLRKENRVHSIIAIMIVQKANYKEIPDFIRWAKDKGFDRVNLSHIRNWGSFKANEFYRNVSMFDRNGQMKPELKMVLEDPVCNDPMVNRSWRVNE